MSMIRTHLQFPPHLLAEIDASVGEDKPCKTRPDFIRAAVREKLHPQAPTLDVPSDVLELFTGIVETRDEPFGAVLTEALRMFIVEEVRRERGRGAR